MYGNNKYGNPDTDQFRKMGLQLPEITGFKLGYEHGIPYTAPRYIPDGCVKMNVQVSEVLTKIAYIKGCLLHNSQAEVRHLHQASRFLETYKKDISEVKREEFENLPIAKEVHPYILEFVRETRSNCLAELEEEAYKRQHK